MYFHSSADLKSALTPKMIHHQTGLMPIQLFAGPAFAGPNLGHPPKSRRDPTDYYPHHFVADPKCMSVALRRPPDHPISPGDNFGVAEKADVENGTANGRLIKDRREAISFFCHSNKDKRSSSVFHETRSRIL